MSARRVPLWRASRVPFDAVAALQAELDIPEAMAWALVRRDLADPERAREFIAADGPLAPPGATPGVVDAAERIALAVRRRERIVIHGDYDCDGVVSTAILLDDGWMPDAALKTRGPRRDDLLFGYWYGP